MAQGTTSTVSRRTVAKGIAWSVPAVAMATAAPAFASSCEYTIRIDPDKSCKKANTNDYRLVFEVVTTQTAGGAQCEVPEGYTVQITRVYESTGQARTLWTGTAEDGEEIIICNAKNMASKVMVTATFPDGARTIQVDMPNFNSTTQCTADDFVCPVARMSTEEAQVDEPVASTEQTEEPTTAAEVPVEEPATDEVQVEAQTEAPAEQVDGEESTED